MKRQLRQVFREGKAKLAGATRLGWSLWGRARGIIRGTLRLPERVTKSLLRFCDSNRSVLLALLLSAMSLHLISLA